MFENKTNEKEPAKKGYIEQARKGGVTVVKNPGPEAEGSRKTEPPAQPEKPAKAKGDKSL